MYDVLGRLAVVSPTMLRRANEVTARAIDQFHGERAATLHLMCECASPTCADMVNVDRTVFDRVVARGDAYVIRAGHVVANQRVVEEGSTWWIVASEVAPNDRVATWQSDGPMLSAHGT